MKVNWGSNKCKSVIINLQGLTLIFCAFGKTMDLVSSLYYWLEYLYTNMFSFWSNKEYRIEQMLKIAYYSTFVYFKMVYLRN